MQQHSGQHLLSAMFEQRLLYETLSWWMAVNTESKVGVSYIELDQEQVTSDELNQIEEACNEAIRQHIPVVTKIYDSDSEELKNAKVFLQEKTKNDLNLKSIKRRRKKNYWKLFIFFRPEVYQLITKDQFE